MPGQIPVPQTPVVDAALRVVQSWREFFLSMFPRDPGTLLAAAAGAIPYWDGQKVLGSKLTWNVSGFLSIAGPNGTVDPMSAAQFPVPYGVGPSSLTNAAGTTLTAAKLLGGALQRSGPAGNFTDTMDTGANIRAALPLMSNSTVGAANASAFGLCLLVNLTAFNWTIQPAAAGNNFNGNLSGGNYVIPATSQRVLAFVVTTLNLATFIS